MTNVRLIAFALAGFLLLLIALTSYKKRQQRRVEYPEIGDMEYFDLEDELEPEQDPILGVKKITPEYEDTYQSRKVHTASSTHSSQRDFAEPRVDFQNDLDETVDIHNDLVVMNLLAEDNGSFAGYELLQEMLAVGLRFGEMNIFHRYAQNNGRSEPLFSVASAQEPGTFNVQDMGSHTCRGLSFFIRLQHDGSDLERFNLMLATAQNLMQELGGSLFDARRELLDQDLIQRYRNTIS